VLPPQGAAQARRTRIARPASSSVKRGGVLRFVNSDYGQNTADPVNTLITNDIVASCTME